MALAQGSSLQGEEKQSMKPRDKKKDFRLGDNPGGESKVLLSSRREQSVATFEKIVEEEKANRYRLWGDYQGRESKRLPPLRIQPTRRVQNVFSFEKIAKEKRAKCCHPQQRQPKRAMWKRERRRKESQRGESKVLPLSR